MKKFRRNVIPGILFLFLLSTNIVSAQTEKQDKVISIDQDTIITIPHKFTKEFGVKDTLTDYSQQINSRAFFFDSSFAVEYYDYNTDTLIIHNVKTDKTNLQKESRVNNKALLTDDQLFDFAKTAWKYFTKNYQPGTGMVNSVHYYNHTTLWDLASCIAGYLCAYKIGVIDITEFREKASTLFATLESIPLYNDELPNREYNTATGEISGVSNNPQMKGSGWSALDIGRLLIWLHIAKTWHAEFAPQIYAIVNKWNFERLIHNNEMYGTFMGRFKEYYRQEGRLGYEQYSATGLNLWGFSTTGCYDYKEIDSTVIFGITIPYDKRNKPFLTSDPFFLTQIELGSIDIYYNKICHKIYEVQKRRYRNTSLLTACTEESVNVAPWFIYNTIYFNGAMFAAVSTKEKTYPALNNISLKTSFAWFAVYDDQYSHSLLTKLKSVFNNSSGFYGGIFEKGNINRSLNLNTNAIVLESICYLMEGRKSFLQLNKNTTTTSDN